MLLQVFSPDHSPWLISEGPPTRQARHAHGTLRFEGSFGVDRLTVSERSLVLGELKALGYARVPADTAQRLMALGPALRMRRRLTRWFAQRTHPQASRSPTT